VKLLTVMVLPPSTTLVTHQAPESSNADALTAENAFTPPSK
jgi:hypothetical protein